MTRIQGDVGEALVIKETFLIVKNNHDDWLQTHTSHTSCTIKDVYHGAWLIWAFAMELGWLKLGISGWPLVISNFLSNDASSRSGFTNIHPMLTWYGVSYQSHTKPQL